ncbi:hypothetical protein H2200_001121 [Cladophialophora chaetospira]|uniref:Heterokaryon incompatibility domain-containing protein n=1 Tax=Cladophialophora chaetospira TaxID=386627 RepID=A0AA38XKA2_9EURO|nr:hypothetical protein H2200_001121 [Cladophialophora chaetospira]
MRLLRSDKEGLFSLTEFIGEDTPPYGILSHTWGADKDEVTLKDLIKGTATIKVGYEKLQFCATRVAADGLEWFWIDTCCIDKTSSAELSEAINSMFQWYSMAVKCYAYLSDVSAGECGSTEQSSDDQGWKTQFRNSRYFTRGWTLQELLAPKVVDFYSKEGILLGDKSSLGPQIQEITGISRRALQGTLLYEFPVSERMSWAVGRQTKREEDMAYSLLGIFDVNMPLIYGEGRRKAMTRLYRELKDSLATEPPAILGAQLRSLGLDDRAKSEQSASQHIQVPLGEDRVDASSAIAYVPCTPLDGAPIAVAFSSPKEIDVMVLGDDSTLKHLRLENGTATTAKWQSDGKWFADAPIISSTSRSRVEVIAPTPYGKVLHQETRTGLLSKEYWESLGHTITGPLTAVAWAPNRLDIFGLGTDGQVLQKTLSNGTWLPSKEGWRELGGSFSLPPQVVSTIPGRLDLLCVKDYGDALYHKWWDGSSWKPSESEWEPRGHAWMSPPTVVATDRNRLDCFMRADGKIHHGVVIGNDWVFYWWSIGHSGPGAFIGRPAAVCSRHGRIEVFCLRDDNELYHKTFLLHELRWDPPDNWNSLGGEFASAPTAVSSPLGKIYIFCKGYDGEVYYMNLDDKEWKSLGWPG